MKKLKPETLANLQALQLRTRILVESVLVGAHRGQQKGFSIDFAEHREYSPGDDVRYLDWKLLGKQDKFYVRQFEDENRLQAWLLLDTSGSMFYRSFEMPLSKFEYAATILAAIGWITCYQRDQAALVEFDVEHCRVTGPVFGRDGVGRLIELLESSSSQSSNVSRTPAGDDDSFHGLRMASESVPSQSVVFLATDAFGDATQLKRILTYLQKKQCDVRLLHVFDPAEVDFPFDGNTLFKGLEGGDYQTQATSIRDEYRIEFQKFLVETRTIAGQSRCEYFTCNTQKPLDEMLRQVLFQRRNS